MIIGPISLAYQAPEHDARLIALDPTTGYITIVNTYRVAPNVRRRRWNWSFERRPNPWCVPGFVSGNFHIDL